MISEHAAWIFGKSEAKCSANLMRFFRTFVEQKRLIILLKINVKKKKKIRFKLRNVTCCQFRN